MDTNNSVKWHISNKPQNADHVLRDDGVRVRRSIIDQIKLYGSNSITGFTGCQECF
jgi:hypothetical protein